MTPSIRRVGRQPVMSRCSARPHGWRRGTWTGAGRNHKFRTTGQSFSQLIAMIVFLAAVTPAGAESVEEFYRGKTITMYVGTAVGAGAVSAYPTALAPLIKKYLPGHPDLIVSYMPGGGGIKAANYIYGIGPQDGTAWGFITRGFLLAPLLKIPQAQFDPNKINWIGSPTRTVSMLAWCGTHLPMCAPSRTPCVRRWWSARPQHRSGHGHLSARAPTASLAPVSKLCPATPVPRWRGRSRDRARRGTKGKVGSTWKSLNSGPTSAWVSDKEGNRPGAARRSRRRPTFPKISPLGLDLAKSPEDRAVLEVLCAPSATGYSKFHGAGRAQRPRGGDLPRLPAKVSKIPILLRPFARKVLISDPTSTLKNWLTLYVAFYALPEAAVDRARDLLPAL